MKWNAVKAYLIEKEEHFLWIPKCPSEEPDGKTRSYLKRQARVWALIAYAFHFCETKHDCDYSEESYGVIVLTDVPLRFPDNYRRNVIGLAASIANAALY